MKRIRTELVEVLTAISQVSMTHLLLKGIAYAQIIRNSNAMSPNMKKIMRRLVRLKGLAFQQQVPQDHLAVQSQVQ